MARGTEPTIVVLAHARAVIEAALVRLLGKPKEHRPFVVIDDQPTGKLFVQFAGSDGENLLFDVPRFALSQRFQREDDISVLAEMAVDTLRAMGLTDETLVRIFEEAGTERPD